MDYARLYRVQHESREPVDYVLDLILTKGAQILYLKYVKAKRPAFLAELFSKTCSVILDDLAISHDKGDGRKMVKRFWPDDKEPVSLADQGSLSNRLLGETPHTHRQCSARP